MGREYYSLFRGPGRLTSTAGENLTHHRKLVACLLTYLLSYLPTYLPTYLPAYLPS